MGRRREKREVSGGRVETGINLEGSGLGCRVVRLQRGREEARREEKRKRE